MGSWIEPTSKMALGALSTINAALPGKEKLMYIGIGTVVLIVLIVLVILMLRRRLCCAAAPTRIICCVSNIVRPVSAWVAGAGRYEICGSGAVARPGRPGQVEAD